MTGVFMIFLILGPLTFAALMLLIATWFSTPFLALMTILVSPAGLRYIASAAAWVFTVATMLVAIPPSAVTGIIFALASVGAGANAIWSAWLAALVAIAAMIVLGLFMTTGESSALILPKVQTAGQALALCLMLAVLAIPPVALCWWLTKPLHGGSIFG
jgi:hypothetical protein